MRKQAMQDTSLIDGFESDHVKACTSPVSASYVDIICDNASGDALLAPQGLRVTRDETCGLPVLQNGPRRFQLSRVVMIYNGPVRHTHTQVNAVA